MTDIQSSPLGTPTVGAVADEDQAAALDRAHSHGYTSPPGAWRRTPYGWELSQGAWDAFIGDQVLAGVQLDLKHAAQMLNTHLRARMEDGTLPRIPIRVTSNSGGIGWGVNLFIRMEGDPEPRRMVAEAALAFIAPYQHYTYWGESEQCNLPFEIRKMMA